jgi:hypothetical protein
MPTRTEPEAMASRCLAAWSSGDLDTTRSLLHNDVSFAGPLAGSPPANKPATDAAGIRVAPEATFSGAGRPGAQRIPYSLSIRPNASALPSAS